MRFVQISDPHIVAPEKQPVLGIDTISRLQDAVTAINRLIPRPDFLVLTGDLTNDEAEASYIQVKNVLSDLTMPCHLAVGNHDARLPFRRIMLGESDPQPNRIYYSFTLEEYLIVVLDTLDEGQVPGIIDEAQLGWFEETLQSHQGRPTVVCLHHPPVQVGVPWMDELILQAPEALNRVMDAYPSVRWVLCGHVHHVFTIEQAGRTVYTAPALSAQFRKVPLPPPAERPHSFISDEPSGFRIVDIQDGIFNTTIHPLASDP